ncbi:glycoside hydrolase family 10 protein [Dictyobacter aurantiacus]|nr:family 10 glycosylhydrolase [Dictyobacter aurantiacus]
MTLFRGGMRRISAFMLACSVVALFMVPGTLSAQAAGTTARAGTAPQTAQYPKRQLRGAWIATVANIDWPSQPGLPIERQKQQFISQLDQLQALHMNAVFVQVRPTMDAFYPSKYVPWSQYLTGVQGKDPGYDPLAFMLSEAHKRNLEFHAWFNPYRVSLQTDVTKLAPNNPARLHPDWVVKYGSGLYFDPGIPTAREFIVKSILEAVRNYDIDGVHFDDYFYPYPIAGQDFPDNATYQRYGAAQFANKADWRRDNINKLIQELSQQIKAVKSYVKFGVSPFGVWRNNSVDPTGSATAASVSDYDDLYADTRTWIKHNWLDYIAPQIYWNIGFAPAAYDILVPWWSNEVEGSRVQLYIGQAAYKINNNNQAWANPEEMPNQLKLNLQYSAVKGSIFFSMKDLTANPLGFTDRLKNDIYRYPALVPIMPWLGGHAPQPVNLKQASAQANGVQLTWYTPLHSNATYYVVYRFDGRVRHNRGDFNNAQYMLATVHRTAIDTTMQTFTDTSAQAGKTYTYYVTALDRLHHESHPGHGQTITLANK